MASIKKLSTMSDRDFFVAVDARRVKRMSEIDQLEPELRACVHDYGWNCVRAFLDIGVRKPRHIRHLVEIVLNELSATRGATSAQGIRGARDVEPRDDDEYEYGPIQPRKT